MPDSAEKKLLPCTFARCLAGLGDSVHARHGHCVRRIDTERQSAPFDGRHSRVLRAAARRTERLQDSLGGTRP